SPVSTLAVGLPLALAFAVCELPLKLMSVTWPMANDRPPTAVCGALVLRPLIVAVCVAPCVSELPLVRSWSLLATGSAVLVCMAFWLRAFLAPAPAFVLTVVVNAQAGLALVLTAPDVVVTVARPQSRSAVMPPVVWAPTLTGPARAAISARALRP